MMNIFTNKLTKNESGYITLISVIVVSAVCVSIAVSMLYNGMVASQTSLTVSQAAEARLLGNSCAEKALSQIREDASISGTALVFTLNGDNCSYDIIKGAGANRTIQATATVAQAKARIKITIDSLNPTVNISRWEEVNAF